MYARRKARSGREGVVTFPAFRRSELVPGALRAVGGVGGGKVVVSVGEATRGGMGIDPVDGSTGFGVTEGLA